MCVANKPILFYALEDVAEAGIREVGIVTGSTGDEIRAAVGDGSQWDLEVTYLPQDAPRGLAHCVLIAREFLGDDDFVVYLGDNLLGDGITDIVDRFRRDRATGAPGARILLARVPDPQRYGVAELDDEGQVVALVEKPAEPPSDLALVGVYLFDAAIHEAVRAIAPSWRDELEITDAIQWLLSHGHPVASQVVSGFWKDTGEVEALLDGNRLVLESIVAHDQGKVDERSRVVGRVVIEAGAELVRSTVRGPAVIGAGTRVVDSYIGPYTSLGDGCEVVGAEVEHSIILSGSRITGIDRIQDSLIGRNVEVRRGQARPVAQRLVLGDHSRVELA